MIAAKLEPDFEAEVDAVAKACGLSLSAIVRLGLSRVLEEYRATGKIELRPMEEKEEVQ